MRGLAALVVAVNVRENALMTEIGTETGIETETGKETTGMIGTEGEGVVLPLMKGDVLLVLTGGQPKSVSMTAQGPHPLLMN